jgi:hypothetical protein
MGVEYASRDAVQHVYNIIDENGVSALCNVERRLLGRDARWMGCFKTRPAIAVVMHEQADAAVWSLRDGSRIATLDKRRAETVDFESVFPHILQGDDDNHDYPFRIAFDCGEVVSVWTFLHAPDDPHTSIQPHETLPIEPVYQGPFAVNFGCLFRSQDYQHVSIHSLADGKLLATLDAQMGTLEDIDRFGNHMWVVGLQGVKRLLM